MKKIKETKYVDYMPKGVPKDQRWFWTERWQKMEREADAEIRKGNIKSFKNWEDGLKYLQGLCNERKKKSRSGRAPASAKASAGKRRPGPAVNNVKH